MSHSDLCAQEQETAVVETMRIRHPSAARGNRPAFHQSFSPLRRRAESPLLEGGLTQED